jgi:hypothetical protein
VKTRGIIADFMTRKDLLKGDQENFLILKLYLNNPNEDKAPLPNGTNTDMINQNSYIKIIMKKSVSENKQNEEFVYSKIGHIH